MQRKMLRKSMATNLQRRRLLQGGAASFSGPLVPFPGSALAAASHRFASGEHDFLLDGNPPQIRCRLQLLKVVGPNAVCAHMFWNYHEWRGGRYE